MRLEARFERGADVDSLRGTVLCRTQRLMEADVEGLGGAAHGERSGARSTYRDTCRERRRDTRAGRIPLEIPKLRQGGCFHVCLRPGGPRADLASRPSRRAGRRGRGRR